MNQCFPLKLVAVSVLAIAAQSTACADEAISDTPLRVKVGLTTGTYTSPSTQTGRPDLKGNLQMLNVGLTYVDTSTGIFVDLTNRSSVGNSTWNTDAISNAFTPSPFKRAETAISVGKMLSDGYHVFGGYQVSNMNLDANSPQFPQLNDQYQLKLKGFFVGGGKALQLGEGWLSMTGSLAMMGASFSNTNTATYGNLSSSQGAGLGYSLGVAYSYPMTHVLSIVPDMKYQAYKPSGWTKADTVTSVGVNLLAKF